MPARKPLIDPDELLLWLSLDEIVVTETTASNFHHRVGLIRWRELFTANDLRNSALLVSHVIVAVFDGCLIAQAAAIAAQIQLRNLGLALHHPEWIVHAVDTYATNQRLKLTHDEQAELLVPYVLEAIDN